MGTREQVSCGLTSGRADPELFAEVLERNLVHQELRDLVAVHLHEVVALVPQAAYQLAAAPVHGCYHLGLVVPFQIRKPKLKRDGEKYVDLAIRTGSMLTLHDAHALVLISRRLSQRSYVQ